jgi:hypothetical protein
MTIHSIAESVADSVSQDIVVGPVVFHLSDGTAPRRYYLYHAVMKRAAKIGRRYLFDGLHPRPQNSRADGLSDRRRLEATGSMPELMSAVFGETRVSARDQKTARCPARADP